MIYLVDTNIFIQSKNFHFGFDFCPGFWDWIVNAHESQQLYSVAKVREEIYRSNDELTSWCHTHLRTSFFIRPDADARRAMRQVTNWAMHSKFMPDAQQEFLENADSYLVAQAYVNGATIVTHERSDPNKISRIKIPDACSEFSIRCISPFTMLREQSVRFVLASK